MRSIAIFLSIALGALLLVSGCANGAKEKSVLDLVPADTAVLGSVRIGAATQDQDVRGIIAELVKAQSGAAGSPGDPIDRTGQEIGIDLAKIGQIVFAAPASGLSSAARPQRQGNAGGGFSGLLFINGEYDKDKVVAALEKQNKGPLAKIAYKGQDILSATGQGAKPGAIVFLRPDLLLLGDESAVKAVIDVQKGDAPAVSGALADGYKGLGDPLVKVYARVPEGALANAAPGNPQGSLAIDPTLLSKLSLVTVTLDKAGERLRADVALGYPDAAAAQKTRDALAGLLSLLKGFINDPATLAALGNLEVKSDGARVTITASLSAADMEALGKITAIAGRNQGPAGR